MSTPVNINEMGHASVLASPQVGLMVIASAGIGYQGGFLFSDICGLYFPQETLTLLMMVVLYAERFSHTMTIGRGSIGVFLMHKNNEEPRILRIYFYQDKIYYWFNKFMYCYMKTPTVRYIYHLMTLMDNVNVSWMNVMLSHVYTNVVKSLQDMCIMKCPLHPLESTLTRYLMPVHTVLTEFHTMDTLTSEGYTQHFSNLLKKTKGYAAFGGHILLLVMVSILEPRYKWKGINQSTHYCQIECYHMYLWRHRWYNNIFFNIFTHSAKSSFFLTDPITLTDCVTHCEYTELRNFIHLHFYNKTTPFQVLSLKELAQCRILVVLVIKRINLIVDLQLGMEKMRDHHELNEKYQNILIWLNEELQNRKCQCVNLTSNKILMRKITYDINVQVQNIFDMAMSLPPIYMFTMLKLSKEYRSMPVSVIRKLDSCGLTI